VRIAQLFGRRLREAPADAEQEYYRLLLRGGYIQQVGAGLYIYLPLGLKVFQKLEQIVREEMDAAGGQELKVSILQPMELWEESGRRKTWGETLFSLKDRKDREFVLGPTAEELFVVAYRQNVQSYRDLPQLVYQIQKKFRDEPRPRGGLLRLREFTMKDLYSFDADWQGLDVSYQKMYDAYTRVFQRAGVPVVAVQADSGTMGGKDSQEFIYVTDTGEDTIVLCPSCGYAANTEKAEIARDDGSTEPHDAVEEVSTPGITTIADLAAYLGVAESKTAKAVFYMDAAGHHGSTDGTRPVFAVIRGDLEVNERKLANAVGVGELRPMTEAEVIQHGIVPGSASAIGQTGMTIVADQSVVDAANLVAGANKADAHLLNTNYGRDWEASLVADIALAREGDPCPSCRSGLNLKRGLEMGHIFKLGTVYAEKLGARFLAGDGSDRPAVMGSYGIGIDRLMAAVVEANHDEKGVIWPRDITPYDVYLVALNPEQENVKRSADALYGELTAAGVRVIYDDRPESPGVKFNDADLVGFPLRVTISPRTLEEGVVEIKWRAETDSMHQYLDSAGSEIVRLLRAN
jgi:prolyl-tRNA synthetase